MRGAMVLAVALPALVAGCGGSDRDRPPAPCPRITILSDGADLTRFRPGAGEDLTALAADARITAFNARCDYLSRNRGTEVTLTVTFEVERGPAATGGGTTLPWFVAISDANDSEIISRRDFEIGVPFAGNTPRARSTTDPISITFPTGSRRVSDYNMRISFALTPEQLAFNRRRGPR